VIVVSNTSPLTNLAAIGHLTLLEKLYGKVALATAVWNELNAQGRAWPGSREVAVARWITVETVQNQTLVTALLQDLDRGEAETIALAIEQSADLVLLDEQEGRRMAQRFGLNVIGVLGVLLEAKARALLPVVKPTITALRQDAGFYLSDTVVAHFLALADEA
jgi:predicted nucleic acid-binding protein